MADCRDRQKSLARMEIAEALKLIQVQPEHIQQIKAIVTTFANK
jgi:hypothetical protein